MIDGFEVKIKRTDRKKTAEIQILPKKMIEVTVPSSFSEERVEKLLANKRTWIISKIKEVNERPEARKKEFVSGESFNLFGKQYRLKIRQSSLSAVLLEADRIIVTLANNLDKDDKPMVAKQLLIKWYKEKAKDKFKSRLEFHSKTLGLTYSGFSVKDFKSRWGSCSPSGHISLNWRLAMAPSKIIDYVIVHELVHLEIQGHSAEYWTRVGQILRDYKERKAELKNLHGELYSM